MVDRWEKSPRNLETKSVKKLQRSELSLDVNEILAIDLNVECLESNHSKTVKCEKLKCCPTLIGSVDFSQRSAFPRTCSALHCRDCDFPVVCFPNHEWSENVEYLYLRTNMPNLEKVSEKLIKNTGSTAYACHCVSFSTDKLLYLHEKNLPWFCRGHD